MATDYTDERGKFRKGNPGRPKGSRNHNGLNEVLAMLKDLIGEKKNLEILRDSLQRALEKNPLGFYYKFIMPLLPKNVALSTGDEPVQIIISDKLLPKKPSSNKANDDKSE